MAHGLPWEVGPNSHPPGREISNVCLCGSHTEFCAVLQSLRPLVCSYTVHNQIILLLVPVVKPIRKPALVFGDLWELGSGIQATPLHSEVNTRKLGAGSLPQFTMMLLKLADHLIAEIPNINRCSAVFIFGRPLPSSRDGIVQCPFD